MINAMDSFAWAVVLVVALITIEASTDRTHSRHARTVTGSVAVALTAAFTVRVLIALVGVVK